MIGRSPAKQSDGGLLGNSSGGMGGLPLGRPVSIHGATSSTSCHVISPFCGRKKAHSEEWADWMCFRGCLLNCGWSEIWQFDLLGAEDK